MVYLPHLHAIDVMWQNIGSQQITRNWTQNTLAWAVSTLPLSYNYQTTWLSPSSICILVEKIFCWPLNISLVPQKNEEEPGYEANLIVDCVIVSAGSYGCIAQWLNTGSSSQELLNPDDFCGCWDFLYPCNNSCTFTIARYTCVSVILGGVYPDNVIWMKVQSCLPNSILTSHLLYEVNILYLFVKIIWFNPSQSIEVRVH